LLVRNENTDDGFWRDVVKEVYADADHLFKAIGEAYNVLSDPDKVNYKVKSLLLVITTN
jgi:DnaJ family protein C protein 7